jgi:hypothetical protein
MAGHFYDELDCIMRLDGEGRESWNTDEIGSFFYKDTKLFNTELERAKETCEASKLDVDKHFKNSDGDDALSRFGGFLLLLDGDPCNKDRSVGKCYFSRLSPKQETTKESFNEIEAKKRLLLRPRLTQSHNNLVGLAKQFGVANSELVKFFAEFYAEGRRGLYTSHEDRRDWTLGDVKRSLGITDRIEKGEIPKRAHIWDYLPSAGLNVHLEHSRLSQALKTGNEKKDIMDISNDAGYMMRMRFNMASGKWPEYLSGADKSIKQIVSEYGEIPNLYDYRKQQEAEAKAQRKRARIEKVEAKVALEAQRQEFEDAQMSLFD